MNVTIVDIVRSLRARRSWSPALAVSSWWRRRDGNGECGHDFFVAFSCKLRCICTSCHTKRELIWAQWAPEELLEEVPHRQVVFTIPKRLRIYFRYDRTLMGDLAACAWRALRLWVLACFDDETAVPGSVGFIQTSGELLNFHPHIHLLITDGVFYSDGTFERFTHFDASLVERLFRAELLRLLTGKGLISQDIVENLLSWRHSGFSAHGEVKTYDRDTAAGETTDLGSAAGISTALPAADDEPFRRRARLTWAALIKKVYEIDPLLCPFCGAEMKIIAFITEHATVRRILEHIHMPPQRPEPLAHSPPLQDELLYA